MYYLNFKDDNEAIQSKFIFSANLYKQLCSFFEFYNYHSNVFTFNQTNYNTFQADFLQHITYFSLYKTLIGSSSDNQKEIYLKAKKDFTLPETISFDNFKYKALSWKEFNSFVENNLRDEKEILEFLPKASVELKEQKFDYQHYKNQMREMKRSVIISSLKSLFSRKTDMNYKVLKSEKVYKKNVLKIWRNSTKF